MGNQGHSSDSIRLFCEWIWDGAIGNVTEIHAGCDAFPDTYCQIRNLAAIAKERPAVPQGIRLGAVAGPGGRPAVPSRLRALELARLDALRFGDLGRLGVSRDRPGLLGAGPRHADEHPGQDRRL